MTFLILLLSTVLTAFVSLSGGFLLLTTSKIATFLTKVSRPFAAAVLIYCAFFDLIPEALEDGSIALWEVLILVFVGTAICFLINYLVGIFHRHGEEKELKTKAEAYSMLIVDSLHTLVDGVVLGVTFAASLGTGLLAAVSTIVHEVPQEIGDFSIMLRSHMQKQKILKLQIASALLLVPAAVLSFFIGGALLPALPPLMALIAGFFLYIALIEIFAMIKLSKK